jgi:acetyl esterase/lipase
MKQILALLALTSSLLIACSAMPAPDIEATVQVAVAATQTAQPTTTPTPLPTATPIPTMTHTPEPTATPTTTLSPTTVTEDVRYALEPTVERLWPGPALGSEDIENTEEVINSSEDQNAFGLNRSISNVSVPTLAIYLPPEAIATGSAVIICPGGAFERIVIDKEGHDVARWLNSIGVAGVVLKYRTGAPEDALLDVQRAIRIVRGRAQELNIRPDRIGVMGFSAGGYAAAWAAVRFDEGQPDAKDALDRISSRPDFVSLIYPAIPENIEKYVTQNTPPAFLVHADDDQRVPSEHSVRFYHALRNAQVRAEIHIYATGGHGFGLGIHGGSAASWPQSFSEWLSSLPGFLEADLK